MQIPAHDFDLATTLDSGQVFHWQENDGGFVGTIGDRAVFVEQVNEVLNVRFDGRRSSSFFANFPEKKGTGTCWRSPEEHTERIPDVASCAVFRG